MVAPAIRTQTRATSRRGCARPFLVGQDEAQVAELQVHYYQLRPAQCPQEAALRELQEVGKAYQEDNDPGGLQLQQV